HRATLRLTRRRRLRTRTSPDSFASRPRSTAAPRRWRRASPPRPRSRRGGAGDGDVEPTQRRAIAERGFADHARFGRNHDMTVTVTDQAAVVEAETNLAAAEKKL